MRMARTATDQGPNSPAAKRGSNPRPPTEQEIDGLLEQLAGDDQGEDAEQQHATKHPRKKKSPSSSQAATPPSPTA